MTSEVISAVSRHSEPNMSQKRSYLRKKASYIAQMHRAVYQRWLSFLWCCCYYCEDINLLCWTLETLKQVESDCEKAGLDRGVESFDNNLVLSSYTRLTCRSCPLQFIPWNCNAKILLAACIRHSCFDFCNKNAIFVNFYEQIQYGSSVHCHRA